MPSTSRKQHNFMAAVAHSPEFAKKAGVPMKVGKDFIQADQGRKFQKGGETMATKKMDMESKKEMAFMKAKKAPKSMLKAEMKEEGYAKGGSTFRRAADGITKTGKTKGEKIVMPGSSKGLKRGGKC